MQFFGSYKFIFNECVKNVEEVIRIKLPGISRKMGKNVMLYRDTSYNNLPPLLRGSQCSKNTACAIITKLCCGNLEVKTFKSEVQGQHSLQYLQLLLNEEKQQVAITLVFHKLLQWNEKHVHMVRM